jgi:CheY-like chemotaxis protein
MRELLQSAVPKPIEMEIDLAPNVPPILGDVNQLRQLLLNLVTNAAEAIGNRSGTVCLRTRLAEVKESDIAASIFAAGLTPGKHLLIQVTDTGIGIDEAILPRIFEPFYSTKFTGRGLGLAVVLGIVRGHGGAILIDSQRGVGTDFRVLLPLLGTEHPEKEPSDSPVPASATKTIQGTVLVVDDEPDVRNVARRILEKNGYEVMVAEDGSHAIAAFNANFGRIDAVLLDLTMPVMTGDQVLEQMRAVDPDVTVILTSGYEEDAVFQRLRGQEPAGFLRKPYRVSDLAAKVREVILKAAAAKPNLIPAIEETSHIGEDPQGVGST